MFLIIYGVFLLLFMYEITLNGMCVRVMDIFVFFLWICSGKSATVLFPPTAANIDTEIISQLMQVSGFPLIFF